MEGSSVKGTTKRELERPVIAHGNWLPSPVASSREVILFLWEVSLPGEGCVGKDVMWQGAQPQPGAGLRVVKDRVARLEGGGK